ncbi:MAG: DUF1080 domain-containing protein [Candidatus Nitrosopolaris sp.]
MANNSDISNDFTIIFDGNNLNEWQMAGEGKFVALKEEKRKEEERDIILQPEGGMGLLWYAKKMYHNFILRLDWKTHNKADNSGVFVRFPYPDNDPMIAVNYSYEIQIDDFGIPDGNPIHQTGSIYGFASPKQIAFLVGTRLILIVQIIRVATQAITPAGHLFASFHKMQNR